MSFDVKQRIEQAILNFSKKDLFESGIQLFNSLGYNTERQSPLLKNTRKGFLEEFPSASDILDFKKAKFENWSKIDLLFQLTQAEMSRQSYLFDTGKVDDTIIEAYLFFAIELEEDNYSRTDLSDITRELNKIFSMPVMVLFKIGEFLTLSVIKRRLHKRDTGRDVLEKVTLIKDIKILEPHRGHIEILYDLSFDKLKADFEFKNFVELHNAWQKILDSSELNKRFYKELANWYFWAVDNVEFPDDVEKDREKRNSINVIRLLTRLIFVWFLKEKNGLVPDDLFNKRKLDRILDYKDKTGSTYYKAILQNLFFATLNTEMNKDKPNNRRFVKDQYLIHEYYRYERFFKEKEQALSLFENIPFLNGGLFECLDKHTDDKKVIRIDCFSDNEKNEGRLIVPDFLFFATEQSYEKLNKVYDTNNKKYVVRGLIEILNKYKFTIHENTPIEEEIALDPELLGRVFENLLASYNEETKTTARKLTGSFYTPREIVNFMVDESLIACLKNKLREKGILDSEKKLRELFSYKASDPIFDEQEKAILIEAIDNCKILDPACGSGAFPMGILHKMVFILNRLDPNNEQWMQRQIDKVYEVPDATLHENLKTEIEKAFNENFNDYGRKLYLIENCIYGIDIQPIAVQIAKLRFFISLIVEQKVNTNERNLGIRPLPNLETKFVAANTLLGIDRPKQMTLRNPAIDNIEKQLRDVRERHFNARTPATKRKYRDKDKELRRLLAELLEKDGFKPEATRLMASWDPYDQNKSAGFFDNEWMFGIIKGFDIIIGNPPYLSIQRLDDTNLLKKANFDTFEKTGDLYSLFYEQGTKLLRDKGILCYITSNKWITANYGKSTRNFFATKANPLILIDFAKVKIFESATVFVNILMLEKAKNQNNLQACSINGDKLPDIGLKEYFDTKKFNLKKLNQDIWKVSNAIADNINAIIESKGIILLDWKDIGLYAGIKSGLNDAFHINREQRDFLIRKNPKHAEIIKPLLRGKDIKRWSYTFADWYILNTHNGLKGVLNPINVVKDYPDIYTHLKGFLPAVKERQDQGNHWTNLRDCAFLLEFDKPKIVWIEISDRANYAYDESGMFLTNSAYFITGKHLKYLLAVLNSKVADYYFSQITATIAGGRKRYTGQYVERVPVPHIPDNEEEPFNKIVDYILYLKKNESNQEARQACNYFENVLEVMVYELYFGDEVREAGFGIIDNVKQLPDINQDKQAFEQLITIYKDISDKEHPIRNSTFYINTIPTIKEIEESFSKNKYVLNES
jgi:adenine-specific DNA-methyltransferase